MDVKKKSGHTNVCKSFLTFKFLCSHLTNVGGKVVLGIRLAYKPIYEQNQYPFFAKINV